MQYKQIKPKKIYEEVAEALHEMIRTGQLKPGDKLESVQQLAENFQVSRSATREALSALKAMGLVEMKQGEGTFVKQFEAEQLIFPLSTAILMNKQDISHLLEVRKIIETGTAASAANNRNTEDLAIMAEALEEMKQAGTSDEELGEKADLKFHLALSAASRNPILSTLLDQVSELMVETMKETRRIWFFSKQTTIEKLYQEHLKIYQAIVEKDEEKARKAMMSHIENVENILKKYFHEAIDNQ
ncbi:FadR/GntR family transcriptional regulator [Sporosarcina sp. ACRSM]|uniref:FadR/GntR family transcriptional regulator n=1 Tax=Sporosarcina sp. ACRSM TaxID=2918216 RepID=UPI002107E27D|nr:FadR/GntR family transcriptional regulator [Sporosarcina sp. ACRSM]